tara:strand:+ start:248 stop:706 length:459 start_codon:yes stop_codon:yes gene_type:complete
MENTNWEEVRKNINGNGMDLDSVMFSMEYRNLYTEVETPFLFGNEEVGWIHINNFCEHVIKDFPILKNYRDNLYDEMIDTFICNDGFIDYSDYENLPEITSEDGFTLYELSQENVYENYIEDGHFEDDEQFKEILRNIQKWREKHKGVDTYP